MGQKAEPEEGELPLAASNLSFDGSAKELSVLGSTDDGVYFYQLG